MRTVPQIKLLTTEDTEDTEDKTRLKPQIKRPTTEDTVDTEEENGLILGVLRVLSGELVPVIVFPAEQVGPAAPSA